MKFCAFTGELLVYIIAARIVIVHLKGAGREAAFTLLNIAAYYYFFVVGQDGGYRWAFALYLLLALVLYGTMSGFTFKKGRLFMLALWPPLVALILVRFVPTTSWDGLSSIFHRRLPGGLPPFLSPYFVGISYLAFRCSRLTLEVRNGLVKKPGFWEYFGFCFFLPTMSVGPINTYENYRRGFGADPLPMETGRAFLRILVGSVKYLYLGTLLSQLSFSGLIFDDHYHSWGEIPVAAIFYYLYLYCNFSGFCDVAIGVSGLIGIPVIENFNDPFLARNVKDFWNRWHISLSLYFRDMVFSPLSKFLAYKMGPANINHAIALTAVCVFLLVGIWHGTGWNFVAFGAFHGIGFAANHYYTIWLKQRLGRDGLRAYNSSRWFHAIAIVLTFLYVSASMFFFANSPHQMIEMWSRLK